MLLHIRIENGIAVSLAQRAEELKLIAAAEIGICKAMEKARARLIAGERIVAGGYRHIFRIFCDTSKRSRSAIDILCGHLARCCPRLIAVDKEFFVLHRVDEEKVLLHTLDGSAAFGAEQAAEIIVATLNGSLKNGAGVGTCSVGHVVAGDIAGCAIRCTKS